MLLLLLRLPSPLTAAPLHMLPATVGCTRTRGRTVRVARVGNTGCNGGDVSPLKRDVNNRTGARSLTLLRTTAARTYVAPVQPAPARPTTSGTGNGIAGCRPSSTPPFPPTTNIHTDVSRRTAFTASSRCRDVTQARARTFPPVMARRTGRRRGDSTVTYDDQSLLRPVARTVGRLLVVEPTNNPGIDKNSIGCPKDL